MVSVSSVGTEQMEANEAKVTRGGYENHRSCVSGADLLTSYKWMSPARCAVDRPDHPSPWLIAVVPCRKAAAVFKDCGGVSRMTFRLDLQELAAATTAKAADN